tara:strand:+ start:132 stop:644 length:513 start_codon:yes stop_codon:yes gene_type:complete
VKKIYNYTSILIFLLLSTSNSFANKIAYIDLDVVLKNSNLGKKIQTQLDSKKSEQLNKIKSEEIEIKQLEDEIRNKQNIISQEELKIEVAELKKRVKDFNSYKNQIKNEFNKNKNEQIMNFFNKIDPLLRAYMKENSIDILLNNKNIIIGKDSLDITEKMINIINNSLKE